MRIQNFGLQSVDRARAFHGYTLIAQLRGRSCFLVGLGGEIVYEYACPNRSAHWPACCRAATCSRPP